MVNSASRHDIGAMEMDRATVSEGGEVAVFVR